MKCPNCFTCEMCKKEYHRKTPIGQQLKEHEERKKTIKGYDDGGDSIEICDPCYQKYVAPNLIPKANQC